MPLKTKNCEDYPTDPPSLRQPLNMFDFYFSIGLVQVVPSKLFFPAHSRCLSVLIGADSSAKNQSSSLLHGRTSKDGYTDPAFVSWMKSKTPGSLRLCGELEPPTNLLRTVGPHPDAVFDWETWGEDVSAMLVSVCLRDDKTTLPHSPLDICMGDEQS